MVKQIKAGVLNVTYMEDGSPGGPEVILLHGFPYDIHAFDGVTFILAAQGLHIFRPYLRGYGPTRFLGDPGAPRSGQQAALAHDLTAFMDALGIKKALLAGFDWGGRAACITAALWPERVRALVSVGGYLIQDIAGAAFPQPPENEHQLWYQYYFHSERGRAGLAQDRRRFCRLLWQLWSPNWDFTDAVFNRTALSFDNPDFVNVVIHSYRHRFGLEPGDPALEDTEALLTEKPKITVPAVAIDGDADGVAPPGGSGDHAPFFTGPFHRRVLSGIGHNPAQEAPEAFARAVLSLV